MSTTATADGMIVVEDVSTTADRRLQNEESCPIYQLTDDALRYCFGFVGDDQYRNVAGVSQRFHDDYLAKFGNKKTTSFRSATMPPSCCRGAIPSSNRYGLAELYLTENGDPSRLFHFAAIHGKLDVLEWAEGSGYKLIDYLSKNCIRDAALNGHYDVIKYLCKVGFPSSWESWKLFSWREMADK